MNDEELRTAITRIISQDGWVDRTEVDVDGEVEAIVSLVADWHTRKLNEAVREAQFMFRAAIEANGGKLEIPRAILASTNQLGWITRRENPDSGSVIFELNEEPTDER